MAQFNPSGPGVKNGAYFGFPYSTDEAEIVILPAELDATASYGDGAAKAPKAILDASVQLDFYDFETPEAWNTKIATAEAPYLNNIAARKAAKGVIDAFENNRPVDKSMCEKVNTLCKKANDTIKTRCLDFINSGKKTVLLGGDHGVALGYIQALSEKHDKFGILQIDAHADLREAYENFEYSHASVMFNALKLPNVEKLVQVGVRDISKEEAALAANDERIIMFSNYELSSAVFKGQNWAQQCKKITEKLPEKVYISFDIDGLDPSLCPNTGTPVAGGLSFNEAVYLLREVKKSGREIIGCDLSEVAPERQNTGDDWDANVGARLLWQLCLLISSKK